jgi:hypothetical protein
LLPLFFIIVTITATIVVAVVVSTIAGIVSAVIVGQLETQVKIGSEFLLSCCSWKLLGILDELQLIIWMLAAKEGLLDIILGWESIRTWHHRSVLDKDVETNEELLRRHVSWDMSATSVNVLNERGPVGIGADRGLI